jgi:membrane-bound acyltransferase YfiQ involved in biofilm formation
MNIRMIQIIVGLASTFFFLALAFYYVPKDAGGSLVSADPICIAAATLAQLCTLLPIALAAVALLVHGFEFSLYAVLARREFKISPGTP